MIRNIIITFLLWIVIVSCCPNKHLITSIQQDSVRVEIHTRSEFIRDTILLEIPVESERQTVRDTVSHLEISYAISDARVNSDGSLFHSLLSKPQKKDVSIEKEIIYRDSIVYQNKIVEKSVPIERELTKWQKFQIKGFWIMSAILVITLFRKKIMSLIKSIL